MAFLREREREKERERERERERKRERESSKDQIQDVPQKIKDNFGITSLSHLVIIIAFFLPQAAINCQKYSKVRNKF